MHTVCCTRVCQLPTCMHAHTHPQNRACARSSTSPLSQCRPWCRQQTRAASAPAHQMLHSKQISGQYQEGTHTQVCGQKGVQGQPRSRLRSHPPHSHLPYLS